MMKEERTKDSSKFWNSVRNSKTRNFRIYEARWLFDSKVLKTLQITDLEYIFRSINPVTRSRVFLFLLPLSSLRAERRWFEQIPRTGGKLFQETGNVDENVVRSNLTRSLISFSYMLAEIQIWTSIYVFTRRTLSRIECPRSGWSFLIQRRLSASNWTTICRRARGRRWPFCWSPVSRWVPVLSIVFRGELPRTHTHTHTYWWDLFPPMKSYQIVQTGDDEVRYAPADPRCAFPDGTGRPCENHTARNIANTRLFPTKKQKKKKKKRRRNVLSLLDLVVRCLSDVFSRFDRLSAIRPRCPLPFIINFNNQERIICLSIKFCTNTSFR